MQAIRQLRRRDVSTRSTLISIVRWIGSRPAGFELLLFRLLKAPEWEESLPNNITMLRARLGFWSIHGFYWPFAAASQLFERSYWILWGAFVGFVAAVVLDVVDGKLARRRNEITGFGRFADPFADKIIVWSAFSILLHGLGLLWWLLVPICGIAVYDIAVSRERNRNKEMPTNRIAKLKQWPLAIGAGSLIASVPIGFGILSEGSVESVYLYQLTIALGAVCLWSALLLAGWSACIYYRSVIERVAHRLGLPLKIQFF